MPIDERDDLNQDTEVSPRPSYLDKVIERYGLDREPERRETGRTTEAEPEEPGTRPEPRQPAREARQEPERREDLPPPRRGALERRQRRDGQLDLLREQVERQNKQIETLLQAVTGSKTPAEIDPNEDPTGWTKKLVQEAVAEGFGGTEILEGLREIVQERRQAAEQEAQQREIQQQVKAYGERITDHEEDYFSRRPDRRDTYLQNLESFLGHVYMKFVQMGHNEHAAEQKTRHALANLYYEAEQNGYNPAEFWDFQWQQTAPPALSAASNGNGNGHEDPKARQSRENRETQQRAKAGQAAGAPSTTAKAPAAATPGEQVRVAAGTGQLGQILNTVRSQAAKTGRDPRKILREGRQAS
jgi:hypothetical protein